MNTNTFNELGLSDPLIVVLEGCGITRPTEIQTNTIPHALEGLSIVASAETGSGKTAAFLLPIIERLKRRGTARALILAPTRELALQIEVNAKSFGGPFGLRTVSIVGGESLSKQIRTLNTGADILIATPGRLNDLIRRRSVRLDSIQVFVLDEADRMLDMGFLPQVKDIVKHLPVKRQTMLFSATVSDAVENLARAVAARYVRVHANRQNAAATVATLTQKAYPVLAHAKLPLLLGLLRQHAQGAVLIFTHTKRQADRLSGVLSANSHDVAILHSDRSQSQRNAALASFRAGRTRVLVATDVAARGIDVDDVSHVINYEVPPTAEDYIHRVGRTARAGRAGFALTLVSPEEEGKLEAIERGAGIRIERSHLSGFSDGRSKNQIELASELGRLRSSSTRSFGPRRASR